MKLTNTLSQYNQPAGSELNLGLAEYKVHAILSTVRLGPTYSLTEFSLQNSY
jgi:hypothetical protein